ncbi:hypothetical protein JOD07_000672 [Defluviitalea raffinosedens]|nr:hypothetical protein [Defluviitalea raffinosedens]
MRYNDDIYLFVKWEEHCNEATRRTDFRGKN